MEQFQRDKRKVIKALKHVKGDLASLEGTKYVTRGFEWYQTVELNRMVRKQRRAVVERVMNVQREQRDRQEREGQYLDHDNEAEEAIALASRQESSWARKLAHQMGLNDEQAVCLGWQEFFAEVSVHHSNSDSETSLSSLTSAQEEDHDDVHDDPESSTHFDLMRFEHVTCMVDNCSTTSKA